MRIVIRADSSPVLGHGHTMRCLALAEELQSRGAAVEFVSRRCKGDAVAALSRSSVQVRWLSERLESPDAPPATEDDLEAEWWHRDALEVTAIIRDGDPVRWLIVDHYLLGTRWEATVRPAVGNIMVIDDLPRRHACELLLDQNLEGLDHKRLLPKHARQLRGPRYALVRSSFRTARVTQTMNASDVPRVLVFFGGGDPGRRTLDLVAAAQSRPSLRYALDVVVTATNPDRDELEALANGSQSVVLHIDTPDMASIMNGATLMVGGAGGTSWERMTLGLPAIVVAMAPNQVGIAEALARSRSTIYLGPSANVSTRSILSTLELMLHKPSLLKRMRGMAMGICDGRGASRVATALGLLPRISVLSDKDSWFNSTINAMVSEWRAGGYSVEWIHEPSVLRERDVAFFLSCSALISTERLALHAHNLVVHASALPSGRGWSPLTWQVLEGRDEIPVTLFEALEKVDSGPIYVQSLVRFTGSELLVEMHEKLASEIARLCILFIERFPLILAEARPQHGEATYYQRRRWTDSKLDVESTIASQFSLLRVVDNDRYPAYFDMCGHRYRLRIDRDDRVAE